MKWGDKSPLLELLWALNERMHVSCLAHCMTHTKVPHTCCVCLPIPHPPIPGVIVREGNELSWEGFRDTGTPETPSYQSGVLISHLVRPLQAAAPPGLPRVCLQSQTPSWSPQLLTGPNKVSLIFGACLRCWKPHPLLWGSRFGANNSAPRITQTWPQIPIPL